MYNLSNVTYNSGNLKETKFEIVYELDEKMNKRIIYHEGLHLALRLYRIKYNDPLLTDIHHPCIKGVWKETIALLNDKNDILGTKNIFVTELLEEVAAEIFSEYYLRRGK